MKNMTEIREKSFFDIEHPDNACVEIKFKTQLGDSEENPMENESLWESITIENNFFDNLTITDEGGFQKMELLLRDRDFVNLEDIILRTIMCSRTQTWNTFYNRRKEVVTYKMDQNGNYVTDQNGKRIPMNSYKETIQSSGEKVASVMVEDLVDPQRATEEALEKQFTFFINSQQANCIKIRFGHSLKSKNGIGFEGRTKKTGGTVLMSPWIYFILLNVNYNINSDGTMSFLLEGISEGKEWFDEAKLMLNGTIIQGTPRRVWNLLSNYISKGSHGRIILQKDGEGKGENQYERETQDFFKFQDKVKPIKLTTLYEELKKTITPDGLEERILSFKPIKQLLDDFVNLCKPQYVTKEGKVIIFADNERQENIINNIHHINKPRWTICPYMRKSSESLIVPEQIIVVRLYYSSPLGNNPQEVKRIYSWKDAPHSLIKNFSVSTKNDFAMLNAPVNLKKGSELTAVSLGSVSYSTKQEYENKVTLVETIKEGLKEKKWTGGFMSTDSFKTSVYNDESNFLGSLIENINNAVFTGELEVFLDPFYLFDSEMLPYTYMIKLEVNRPTRFTANNNISTPSKSYLSGNYLISKIVHTISYSSATTKLSIIKFPDVDEKYNETGEVVYSGAIMRDEVIKLLGSKKEDIERMNKDIQDLYTKYIDLEEKEKKAREAYVEAARTGNGVREALKNLNSINQELYSTKNELNDMFDNREEIKETLQVLAEKNGAS